MTLQASLQTNVKTAQECRRAYWNRALTKSAQHPFPLAPPDLVAQGLMTEAWYESSNRLLSDFVTGIMLGEISLMMRENHYSYGDQKHIEILGAGLTRDLKWIPAFVKYGGFSVGFTDYSSVACNMLYEFIRRNNMFVEFNTVREMDVEEAIKQGLIDKEKTTILYAGQFFQNQKPRTKDRYMRYVGEFLKSQESDGLRRKAYVLHPPGEKNPPEEVWWRNTKPYTILQLQKPTEQGYGGPVRVRILGTHEYCGHQTYSLLSIEGAG